ncbi:hypothetical protein K504DRAFT_475718 [Pleomassaria siparia CBS 279.74]|uniref:Uncharacterized protein n=1 Tax=Pleomassaria siparia CBS 279.74 TaxID=1314801 RepID=A0A6G1KDZ6_9PLEO|nr:hypothetical protein K504DRAFT_475718 [Pleomassaria siparia CBS 279.74]
MLYHLLVVGVAVLLNTGTAAAQRSKTPCQSVSSMSVAFMASYPTATAALIPGQAAEDCLRSVPIDVSEDQALIDEMQYFIDWQSNLAWLKNPPEGYTEKKADILEQIKNISSKLSDYEDEYTLQSDLALTLAKSYDFHFVWSPDMGNIFRFRRGNIGLGLLDEFALVSVSSDGKELPQLYNYYDIIVGEEEGWTPSPVTQINNQTAEDYIQNWSVPFPYHEDHARYNRLFPNQAQISTGARVNLFGRSNTPDGDYTTVTHKNGSVFNYVNSASIPLDSFDYIRNGQDLFDTFCNQGPPSPNSKRSYAEPLEVYTNVKRDITRVQKRQTEQPTATGFPTPKVLHSEAVLGGYYLNGTGYDDVAVLSVPSFSPDTDKGPAEFQDITGSFLKTAAADGKKKLVIDLRGNGGGRVFLGYDMFKQLFPSMDPYGASQFRANEAFDITGQAFTEAMKDVTYEAALKDYVTNGENANHGILWQSIFNYKLPLTVDNKNFTSWADYFGPHEINGDNFTSVSRKDLNNFFSDDLSLDVTGFRTRANKLNKDQPFQSANIVLLQDGGCGSTCAVFSEFMKNQGGVNQVVVGGVPRTGPMQGVSGSKGSQVYTWSQVYTEAAGAFLGLTKASQKKLNDTDIGKLVYTTRPLQRSAYQSNGQSASVINLRDNIRDDDTGAVPLNFIYEAADCRLFYTADMVRDTTNVWKKAVDANWGDQSKVCVEGSTGHESAVKGKAVLKNGNAETPTSTATSTPAKSAATRLASSLSAAMVAALGLLILL